MAAVDAEAEGFAVLHDRYLHVTPTPCHVDEDGSIWMERSWHHDFVAHLDYLKRFTNCAPRLRRDPRADLVRFELPPGADVSFIHLPSQSSYLTALLNLPRTFAVLWRAIGQSDIVQSSVGGWPYPIGWIVNPIALLRRKRLILNVESDWRLTDPGRDGWRHRLADMNPVRDLMARWFMRRADLALFTHANYRDALCARGSGNAFVTPAVWVKEEDVLDEATAEAAWARKVREPARFLCAGRLVPAKGIEVLLAALRSLDARGVDVRVDIIGQGELRADCLEAASSLRSVRLEVLEPVPYGRAFFELLRAHHAVLVPSLTDEQPRILFDAYAQAVPVIASDTAGLRPYVEAGITGSLVPAGDAGALASAIEQAARSTAGLRSMGLAALRAGRGLTHRAMHRWRSRLIRDHCTPGSAGQRRLPDLEGTDAERKEYDRGHGDLHP